MALESIKELTEMAESAVLPDETGRIKAIDWYKLEKIRKLNPLYHSLFLDTLIDELIDQGKIKQGNLKIDLSKPIACIEALKDSKDNKYFFEDMELGYQYKLYLQKSKSQKSICSGNLIKRF